MSGEPCAIVTINQAGVLAARAFVEPLIEHEQLDSGERVLAHADAMVSLLDGIGATFDLQMAVYLSYAVGSFARPKEILGKRFGEALSNLATDTADLMRLQRQAGRLAPLQGQLEQDNSLHQTENIRKMLLAFSRDLRVVLLRLSSRLQSLRYFAKTKQAPSMQFAQESLHVFAPLANRLGFWQLKWEIEDLAFRFLEPETYQQVASLLDQKRSQRDQSIQLLAQQVLTRLQSLGLHAQVYGRAKHIYSIVKKMRGKSLPFERVFDLRALRVIVHGVDDCYTALAVIHTDFEPVLKEFDDYIAKPKANGYQSLHTIVREPGTHGQPIEFQIRTQAMHELAESGVAAHWAYKEAGVKGYSGVKVEGGYDAKIAVVRQLLAWSKDMATGAVQGESATDVLSDRIYVLTPDAKIIDLQQGATAVDFAYALHTDVGHRCRGARVDGVMVPLNTPLQNGQSVEIITGKEGGPSRDWLNSELGFIVTARAKSKVRAWFNLQQAEQTTDKGRTVVERVLQREGKTAIAFEDLAQRLDFESVDAMFFAAGKDALSTRAIETAVRPAAEVQPETSSIKKSKSGTAAGNTGVVVVGVGALMNHLAQCCKPAPPDPIEGYVTKGRGIAVHRLACRSFQHLKIQDPDRVIAVAWSSQIDPRRVYAIDIALQALDRQGLLRDITELLAKDKVNVIGVNTQSVKGGGAQADIAWMTFTLEMTDTQRLPQVVSALRSVKGVRSVQRR